MTRFLQLVRSLTHREEAQDLLEYALLVALIALVAVGAVTAAGGSVNDHLRRHRCPDLGGDLTLLAWSRSIVGRGCPAGRRWRLLAGGHDGEFHGDT